eukprot:scaffold11463_cov124-Isochrysis_galbana.AAC.12
MVRTRALRARDGSSPNLLGRRLFPNRGLGVGRLYPPPRGRLGLVLGGALLPLSDVWGRTLIVFAIHSRLSRLEWVCVRACARARCASVPDL